MTSGLGENPLSIILLLAVLSLLPLLLMICTAFLKISMVLIITRNAIGVQQVPPNMAMYAVALAATLFIMAPVAYQISDNIKRHPIEITTAEETLRGVGQAGAPLQSFMMKNTAPEIARHLLESAKQLWPKELANAAREDNFLIVVPAFVLSELQAGFKIGFLIYLPFVVIDLIISNLLLALGMQMVSPMTISLPLKLLLFVLVEGWTRLLDSLFYSYL